MQAPQRLNMYFSVKNEKASEYDCHFKVLRAQSDKIEVPAKEKNGMFLCQFVYWSMETIEERSVSSQIKVVLTAAFHQIKIKKITADVSPSRFKNNVAVKLA